MKLISETNFDTVGVSIQEDKATGKKQHFIEGIFMQGGIKNRNGRMYPMETLDKEVSRYNDTFVKNNRAYGELGHPDGPTINLERVSHMIKELKREGNDYVGKAKIMDTPYGKIVKNLIDEGAKLGVSSRGMGSLQRGSNGQAMVGKDFYLATAADIVADPSAPDAFVEGIMENKEWIWDNGIIKEREIEEYKEYIAKAKRLKIAEAKANVFSNFLKKL